MYEQSLYKVVEPVKLTTINRLNKGKKWEYGYDKQSDVVVISKSGQIGDIIQIQGLNIALPKPPKDVYKCSSKKSEQKWCKFETPDAFSKIKTRFDWEDYPKDFKEKYYSYIDQEFNRRDNGFWFTNHGKPTYLPGSYYMYLQWSKIDVGAPDFREANRLFFIFWEACKADRRCYGMCYLKNRRSGFSFMSSAETVNLATLASDSRFV